MNFNYFEIHKNKQIEILKFLYFIKMVGTDFGIRIFSIVF